VNITPEELKLVAEGCEARVINIKGELLARIKDPETIDLLEKFQQEYRTFCEYRLRYYDARDKEDSI